MLHLRRGASSFGGLRVVTMTAIANLVRPYGLTPQRVDAAVTTGIKAGIFLTTRSKFKNAHLLRVQHGEKQYAVKLFSNLRVQLTGLKDLETLKEVVAIIATQLTRSGIPTFLDDCETKICLVNYAFDTQMRVGLRNLKTALDLSPHPQLRLTFFDSDKRQAVSAKFLVQNRLISFSIFESGKLNISCPHMNDFDASLSEIHSIVQTYFFPLMSVQNFEQAFFKKNA
jgi:TATA-box binding protein (TBP) (component of TFIID and TFIIIB)